LERIVINTSGSVSEILVGADWKGANQLVSGEGVIIVTDSRYLRLNLVKRVKA
jgi:hypothetical protein